MALLCALALALASCGGASSSSSSAGASSSAAASSSSSSDSSSSATPSLGAASGEVIAKVASTPITRTQVNHWMGTLAGGDYYELSANNTVPANLVSDPPRYSTCVAQLEAAAASSPRKLYAVTGVQLLSRCRQLYQALRSQAAAFLVRALFVSGLASDFGVSASDQEVLQFYKKNAAERFPQPADASRYLSARRESLSDELLILKLNLLSQKILAKVKAQGSSGAAKLSQAEARWTAQIDCEAGYVVEHCKQFHGEAPHGESNPSPSVLMEKVAAIATGRCTNTAACGKP